MNFRKTFRILGALVIGACFVLGGSEAFAQANQQKNLGQFRDWSAFSVSNAGILMCFAASKPLSSLPSNVNRDPTYFFVTTRPTDKTVNETSIDIGYTFKASSKVVVTIDGKNFDFHTEGKFAWLTDIRQESNFIAQMRRGKKMTVRGESSRGTKTTDEYSLLGITAALGAVGKNCQ